MAPDSNISNQQPPAVNSTVDIKPHRRLTDVLRVVIFLGIGLFFIYWFLLKLDADQKAAIWQSFRDANYFWVAVAMAVSLLSHFVRAMRWRLLYAPIGFQPHPVHIFGSVIVGYMANLAFPRAGEVVRCATLRTSEDIPIDRSLGTVVTERMIDMIVFALIVLTSMVAMFGQAKDWLYETLSTRFNHLPNMAMIVASVVLAAILIWTAYKLLWKRLLKYGFFRKIDSLCRGLVDGVKSILHLGTRRTLLFIAYSVVIYLLYILGGYIIFKAFAETSTLGLGAAFVVYLFGTVGMTFSQGGIGVYPVLVQLALEIYDIPLEVGTACGWLLWGAQQAAIIAVGAAFLLYFAFVGKNKKKCPKMNTEHEVDGLQQPTRLK